MFSAFFILGLLYKADVPCVYCFDSFENNHSSVGVCWCVVVMGQHEGIKTSFFPQ